MKDVRIAFRKPIFPVSEALQEYLEKHNRTTSKNHHINNTKGK